MIPYVLAFALAIQLSAPISGGDVTSDAATRLMVSGVIQRVDQAPNIDLATLRRAVKGFYPKLDLDGVDKTRKDAIMVVLLFDQAGNIVRHARVTRTSDRMFALDALNDQFKTSLTMTDVKQAGIAALTGPRDGVVPGTVWVCWGELRR